jgi:NADPH-dependent 2,4-dienoyl-CoA reductase/sulfur reductase-like enzyme
MTSKWTAVIIGGGPAGLAAADTLCHYGIATLVLDENQQIGGQVLRRRPTGWKSGGDAPPIGIKRAGMKILDQVTASGAGIMRNVTVLALTPEREIMFEASNGRVDRLQAEMLLLAGGGREKFFPFKGWTLPGVISTGAAQILMKNAGVLPGRNVLVAGSGPLPLVAAGEILKNGGKLAAFIDINPMFAAAGLLRGGFSQIPRYAEGLMHLSRIVLSRSPRMYGRSVIEVAGDGKLEHVITVRIDDQGRSVPGSQKTFVTDTLAVGRGFAPNIELPHQVGCELEYSAARGGWIVKVDSLMETSLPEIFAAGEVTGIGGAKKALLEGRLAGLSMLRRAGHINLERFRSLAKPLRRQRQKEVAFAELMNKLSRIRSGEYDHLDEDTIICRCEDVTFGDIRKQMERGLETPDELKKALRLGMGNCQGRTCGPILDDMLNTFLDSKNPQGPLSVRMPVKPVSLESLGRSVSS